jgi:streptomycin 6-kinase
VADLAGLLRGVSRHRLVERFGVEADAWCDDLPALIDAIARIWRLRIETLLPGGANSIVLACTSDDGESLVLKLTPDLRIAAEEAAALSMWASCRHVVALKDSDIGRGALLLEAVGPGVKLSDDPGGWSLEDVAPMLAGLWEPRAVHSDSYLPKLSDRVDVVFDLAMRRLQRWVAGRDRVGGDVMDRSHACARELAAAGPAGLVHGDLHPGNVLPSGQRASV